MDSDRGLTGAAVNGLLQDLQLVVKLGEQGALAERPRDEATLELVGDVVTCCDLLLRVSWLSQQLARMTRQEKKEKG